MNRNVRDALYMAVEEYTATITDPKRRLQFERMTDKEKEGIFYNTLRRNISFFTGMGKLAHIDNFKVTLNSDGTLNSLKLMDAGYVYWGETITINQLIKQILAEHSIFETTVAKNEILDIVNSIKSK